MIHISYYITLSTTLANPIIITIIAIPSFLNHSFPFFIVQRLQILIRKVFRDATRNIKIPGSEVIGIPLFAAMNGKNTREYSQRVEPSSLGNWKSPQSLNLTLFLCVCSLVLYSSTTFSSTSTLWHSYVSAPSQNRRYIKPRRSWWFSFVYLQTINHFLPHSSFICFHTIWSWLSCLFVFQIVIRK